MKKIIAAIDGLKFSDSAVHYAVHLAREKRADQRTREEAVDHFTKACREAGLNFSIHHDKSIALH